MLRHTKKYLEEIVHFEISEVWELVLRPNSANIIRTHVLERIILLRMRLLQEIKHGLYHTTMLK